MYGFLLHFHSGFRWIVLLVALTAVFKSLVGFFNGRPYSKFDKMIGGIFVGTMHLQFLVGLLLYFIFSPFTNRFTFNMTDPNERFWSIEHTLLMFFAVIFAQIGRIVSKRTDDERVKFRSQSIFFGLSLALLLIGIPWNRL